MLYDYFCPTCDKEKIDVQHGMNEKPEIKCECGSLMRKKIGGNYQWGFHPLKWSLDYGVTSKANGGKKK